MSKKYNIPQIEVIEIEIEDAILAESAANATVEDFGEGLILGE